MHPFWLQLGLDWLPPHRLFESLAYLIAGFVYRCARRRDPIQATDGGAGVVVALGAIIGAAFGAQVLAILQHAAVAGEATMMPGSGRTIVGGILGGWAGVELAKRCVGAKQRTGDAFVPALAVGIAVGRVGCFFAGVADDTHGLPSRLPWAMDLGDGILRHPTALCDIASVAVLGVLVSRFAPGRIAAGGRFRLFVCGYLAWRFAIDFVKPAPPFVGGLTAIQLACLLGVAALLPACFRAIHSATRRDPERA